MCWAKKKEYQVTQLAKLCGSSAAKKWEASKKYQKKEACRAVKAVDKVLSAKIKSIPHPKNESNCTFRNNQEINLTPVPSPIPALAPAPAPAPPPLPTVQSLLYQQQVMHLGLEILLLSSCRELWQQRTMTVLNKA